MVEETPAYSGGRRNALPPATSPDFNPVEGAFANLKALPDLFPLAECANYFGAAGCDAT